MGSGGDRLVVITWNVGDNGTKKDLTGMLDRADVLCLQEMSDRQPLYDLLHDHGWKTYNAGGDNGRKATPIAWDPHVMGKQLDTYCRELSPKTHAPGTGPDDVKAKWLIGIGWDYPNYGHEVRVGCLHLVSDSGSGNKKRHELAHDEVCNASTMWKHNGSFPKGACVIAGDWNTSYDNDLLDPMRKQKWKPSQGDGNGVYRTHGNWTPDQQWYRNSKVYNCGQIATGSDHDAYWVSYQL